MNLITGQKLKLSKLPGYDPIRGAMNIRVNARIRAEVDITCFGLDQNRTLSDDRYMIFYNQLESPEHEIHLKNHTSSAMGSDAEFELKLDLLPESIHFLTFAATIDGLEEMSSLENLSLQIIQQETVLAEYTVAGTDFSREKAVILLELYFNQEWRINAVGKGFFGGLAALLTDLGGEFLDADTAPPADITVPETATVPESPAEAETTEHPEEILPAAEPEPVTEPEPPAPEPIPEPMSEPENPAVVTTDRLDHLVAAARQASERAEVPKQLADVALCLDISTPMADFYSSGQIETFKDNLLALSECFEQQGGIDLFLFGKDARYAGKCTRSNRDDFISQLMQTVPFERTMMYHSAIKMIRTHYLPFLNPSRQPISIKRPVYVLFLTCQDTLDRYRCEKAIRLSSYEPIFWSFIGLGDAQFKLLNKLENLGGKLIDNTTLLKAATLSDLNKETLFDDLLKKYGKWIPQAKRNGLFH